MGDIKKIPPKPRPQQPIPVEKSLLNDLKAAKKHIEEAMRLLKEIRGE